MDKKMYIILINGVAQAGKDTFVKACTEYAKKSVYYPMEVFNLSLIDYDKDILKKHYGWNGEKTPEIRAALSYLQSIGMDRGIQIRDITKKVMKIYEKADGDMLIFVHARRDEHLIALKSVFETLCIMGGKYNTIVKSVYISRPGLEGNEDLSGGDKEAAHSKFDYDVRIRNDSSLDVLEFRACHFIDEEIRGGF